MNDVPARRRRRTKSPTTPDPIEIAMEAVANGAAPRGIAHEVLAKQSRLLDEQIALSRQERLRNRMRTAREAVFAAAAALAVGAVAWVLVDASRASGIVIQPFDTTPALVAQGLGGEAVANDLLGRLAAMQAGTESARSERRASSATDEVTVVIPQAGISVGEAMRLLRARLGHETPVSGSLRTGADGMLEVSLRVNGRRVAVPPPAGAPTVDGLLEAAAQAVMRETDPYRYAQWLSANGRVPEGLALVRRLTQQGPPSERAWAWAALAARLADMGRPHEAIAAAATAHQLDPGQVTAMNNMASAEIMLGRDERVLAAATEGVRTIKDRTAPNAFTLRITEAMARHDEGETERVVARMLNSKSPSANFIRNTEVQKARVLAARHEATASLAARAAIIDPPFRPLLNGRGLATAIQPYVDVENWSAVESLLQRPWTPSPGAEGATPWYDRVVRWPWQAYLAARSGRFAEAERLIGATPSDCYLCVRMRGEIAALKGDAPTADRWIAEAIRQGPSLADAELAWGRAKLARGDARGALTLFETAAEKAPAWADPLKYSGDALVRLGQPKRALTAYRAAAKRAPRWGGLHLEWGEALARQGKAAEARTKWRAAAGMDLTPSERARVNALLQQRTT